MDCSYCKKDMAELDICPHCGMGRRIDYELFKTDKAERQKDFEEYERNYLNKSNGKEESSIPRTTRHTENHDILPSKESTSQKVVGFGIVMAIVIGLGILTGALLRAGSP